jgi:hypothetical protein
LPKREKHLKSTTCDFPANSKSKLLAAQGDVIESTLSEEDVSTNEETVPNPLRSTDTSIGKVSNIIMNNIKFSKGKHANPASDVPNPMETKRAETIPNRRLTRIASYYIDSDFAKFKVSTHLASATSSDNPFVMLNLDKMQEANVDDKNSPKHMLDGEDYEPPTRRLCKNHATWEEAEQDEL